MIFSCISTYIHLIRRCFDVGSKSISSQLLKYEIFSYSRIFIIADFLPSLLTPSFIVFLKKKMRNSMMFFFSSIAEQENADDDDDHCDQIGM